MAQFKIHLGLKRISIIIILGFLVIACNNVNRPKKPDNLISKDQMTELLYDLYIVNSAKGVNRRILETNGFNPETYILTKYNIDSTQFADSNGYYAFDTETYKGIVEKVKERLEKEKQELEDIKERKKDSIKKRKDSTNKKVKELKASIKNRIDSVGLKKIKLKDL